MVEDGSYFSVANDAVGHGVDMYCGKIENKANEVC